MIGAISTALSGLFAASKRVEASASNIANISTTGALDESNGQKPYTALTTVQDSSELGGVTASNIPKDPGYVTAYDPNSPHADSDGLIGVPNVDLAEEAVNLKIAETAYRASLSVIKTADEMSDELLNTFDDRV